MAGKKTGAGLPLQPPKLETVPNLNAATDQALNMAIDEALVPHKYREDGSHYNGGEVFFGYGYVAVGEPRLKMIRRWYRQGAKRGMTEDHFFVDGQPVDNYERAVDALVVPPSFTPDEISALGMIGDEPSDWRKIIDFHLLHSLAAKGAVAWGPPGRCQRTDAGREALASYRGRR